MVNQSYLRHENQLDDLTLILTLKVSIKRLNYIFFKKNYIH